MKAILHKCEWINEKVKGVAQISKEEITLPKENRLEFLQKLVGGLIDIFHYNGKDYVINDEGILLGLPINPFRPCIEFRLRGNVIEVEGVLD